MEEFKVGKTYKLLDDKVNRFFFTSDIRDLVDLQPEAKKSFSFTPDRIDAHGDAYVGTVCVACLAERSFFEMVAKPEKTPKVKKPFKVGATYKLKKKHVNDFIRNTKIRSVFGNGVFKFTASQVLAVGARCEDYQHGIIAVTSERHMFKRIDNK